MTQTGAANWIAGLMLGGEASSMHPWLELVSANIQQPALFLGDSKYDYQAARAAGLYFIFLSGWSEVTDWQQWAAQEGIRVEQDIKALTE